MPVEAAESAVLKRGIRPWSGAQAHARKGFSCSSSCASATQTLSFQVSALTADSAQCRKLRQRATAVSWESGSQLGCLPRLIDALQPMAGL